MKIIRSGEVAEQDATGAPIFFGGAVSRQPLIGGELSKYYSFNVINFAAGARNKLHTHTTDQILYVTSGRGTVATANNQVEVWQGDTIFIPAGEKHWHGAAADSDFSHISLTTPDNETRIVD